MPDPRGFTYLLCTQTHVAGSAGDDEEIARLALRQHGVVARQQLLALGVSARALHHRVATGRLRRLHPGVYAVGHEALTHPGRVAAAVLATHPAAASYWSAAALHGLIDTPGGAIHITATQPRTPRRGIAIHRAALPAVDLSIAEGIPTTTVERTLLDLSASSDEGRLRRLIKRAEFERLTDTAALAAVLERHPKRRGRRTLARVVESRVIGAGRTRSELEDRFLEFCLRRGLPLPETNVVLEVRGGQVEVDCVWRDRGLVVELDGHRAHGNDSAFHDDRARDRALIAAGWSPMRVTWAQLHLQPDELEAEIRAVVGRRGEHPRGFTYTGGT